MFGKISRSNLLRVVFPLEEQPLMPTTKAFRGVAIVGESRVLVVMREEAGLTKSMSPEKRTVRF